MSPGALSFADIAHHLLHAGSWLFEKMTDPALHRMSARVSEAGVVEPEEYQRLLEQLVVAGEKRAALLGGLSSSQLAAGCPDDRFGGEVSLWWVVVRGSLDHEAHHRGQLAAYLRFLDDQRGGYGS